MVIMIIGIGYYDGYYDYRNLLLGGQFYGLGASDERSFYQPT